MTGGFGESRVHPFQLNGPERLVELAEDVSAVRHKVKVGPGGRIVIPALLRELAKISEGDTLVLSYEHGELQVLTMGSALERARAMVRAVVPAGVSLGDELIADRRAENERDSRD